MREEKLKILEEKYKDAREYIFYYKEEIERLIKEIERLNNIVNEATYYIKQNCILSDMWVDLGFCDFAPTGKITYKSLSQKKVRKLLDILDGSDKE